MTDREIAEARILAGPDCPAKRFLLARVAARERAQNPPPLPKIEKIVPPVPAGATERPACAPPKMFTGPALYTGQGRPHRWEEIAGDMVDDGDHVPDVTKMVSAGREAGEGE